MPLYQFTISRGQHDVSFDPIELSSRAEAWREASETCAAMLKDINGDIVSVRELKVRVAESSTDLFCVRAVAEVLE